MKPVILLIDLQNDFLSAPSLVPAAGKVVDGAARLLTGGRSASIPIIHVWTSVDPAEDRRMPHWKRGNRWICVAGTVGHEPPPALRPSGAEPIIRKTFFSAFSTGELGRVLDCLEADTLILAGVHLHGCIRATVLDAYAHGFTIWVAEDAVASDDPLHAAMTRRYLEPRAARFASVEDCLSAINPNARRSNRDSDSIPLLPAAIVADVPLRGEGLESLAHASPRQCERGLWRVPVCGPGQVACATTAAKKAWNAWRTAPVSERCQMLQRLAGLLNAHGPALAQTMAMEIGKPLTLARAEITRSVALLRAVMERATDPLEARCTADSVKRHEPAGVIAMVTPWNNPLAIPLGKIAPALLYGNTVVWKPAPAGSSIAVKLMQYLLEAGCPAGVVNLVCGDRSTALTLMSDPQVDAVTLTGSPAAGYSAQDICGRRHVPLQAELGGNNAAIIWPDCDQPRAAAELADAAFAFAGQRCTANRRVIVEATIHDRFLESLQAAVSALVWGDPLDAATRVGPLISLGKRREVAALVERAKAAATTVLTPHRRDGPGAYFPPTIICCDDPMQEVVQEETFGPVLVVQIARDWSHAMQLCNGVRQGLVASLFSASREMQDQFLANTRAGILKINRATADANVEAPFGGWKASGLGPPEHGTSNREFHTRTQSVYRGEC